MPRLLDRQLGGSLQLGLPASAAYATTAASAALSPGAGSASVAFWAMFPGYATGVNAAVTYGTSYTVDGFSFVVGAGNIVRIYTKSVATSLSITEGSLPNVWARYVLVLNATGNVITVYRNGVQIGTGSAKWTGSFNANDVFVLGKNPAGVLSAGCAIQDVCYAVGTVWSLSDIQNDYYYGKTLPGLTQRWPLDDGSASTARETISGTLAMSLSAATFSSDSPMLVRGLTRNLFANSSDLSARWYTNGNNGIISAGGIANPVDGLVNTAKWQPNAPYGLNFYYLGNTDLQQNKGLIQGFQQALFSVYVKRGNLDWVYFAANQIGQGIAYFNVSTGAWGTVDTTRLLVSSNALSNSWYRLNIFMYSASVLRSGANTCTLGFTSANGATNFTAVGTEYTYVYGAMLEAPLPGQTTASPYLATGSAPLSVSGPRNFWPTRSAS